MVKMDGFTRAWCHDQQPLKDAADYGDLSDLSTYTSSHVLAKIN